MDLEALSRKICYSFQQSELFRQALVHRSYGRPHNERLEFLGDSVLNCVIAAELYRLFPKLSEGELSRLRANLVNQATLVEVAHSLHLGVEVMLGEGELKSGGHSRASILADALEALFGAVMLDGGFDQAQRVVLHLFCSYIRNIDPEAPAKDAKTRLQEYLQSLKLDLPRYHVIETHGSAHEQQFEVECAVLQLGIRTLGHGRSRRAAEQGAADEAYRQACSHAMKETGT
jgi:ribonuclease III